MTNIGREIVALKRMTPKELRAKYADVTGETTRCGSRPALVKKLAWRLQALEEGGLSERAKRRAEQLARDSDIRLTPPTESTNGTGRLFLENFFPSRSGLAPQRHKGVFRTSAAACFCPPHLLPRRTR